MKDILSGLFMAFSLYSAIPMPKTEWNRRSMRYILCFFPLVGVVIGVLSLLWYVLARRFELTPALFAAVAVLLPLVASGGIHMDGFIDTADAISSHGIREKKLAILKDSHVGAFGVLYCAGYLLLSFGLWQQLYPSPRGVLFAVTGYAASRCLSSLSVVFIPLAKQSGLLYQVADSSEKKVVVVCCVFTGGVILAAAGFVWAVWPLAALAVCAVYFWWHRRFCLWEFGGNTGDLAGFLLQNVELLILILSVIIGALYD